MAIDRFKSEFKFTSMIGALIILVWVCLTINIIWTLNRGLIFHDESWELLQYQQGAQTIDYSNWHRVLQFLYIDNLFQLRLLTFGIISSSAFFLGYTSSRLFDFPLASWIIGLLFIVFQFFLNSPVKLVPSYTNMNFVLINIAVSFLLLFIFEKRELLKIIFIGLCSFFISILPFVLVTNTVIIGVLFVFIFIYSAKNKLKYCVIFILCLFIYPVIYFKFIQSPSHFWEKYEEARYYLSIDADYGLYGIFKWHAKMLIHFLQVPLLIFFLFKLKYLKIKFTKNGNYMLMALFLGLLLIQLYQDVTFKFSQFPVTLWYLLFFLMLWASWKELWQKKPDLILVLFFASLPYFASLGTVVRFQLKAASFFPYLAIAILFLIKHNYSFRPVILFTALSMVSVAVFFSYNFRTGWSNYNVLDQTERFSISQNKGDLYLDRQRVKSLEEVRPYIGNNEKVLVSHENVWGYVYLLNARPLYLAFRFKENYFYYFLQRKNESPYSITYIELKRKPFPETFKTFLNGKQSSDYSLQIVDLNEFRIYTFHKT